MNFTDYTEPYADTIKTADFILRQEQASFTSISDSLHPDCFMLIVEGVKNNYELNNTCFVIKLPTWL